MVRVNGTELFHEFQGEGEPLVLVHGSWGDHFNWRGVAPGLAAEEVAFGPGAWEQLPDEVRETFESNAPTWINEGDYPAWSTLDLGSLSAFPAPALLTEGDQSPPWFPVIIRRLAEVLKRSRHHVFLGAGHVPT